MFVFLSVLIKHIVLFPRACYFWFFDIVNYIKTKRWLLFEQWGLHVYVGKFGASKTSSMVEEAYALAKRYPGLNVITNLSINNFPADTNILPLKTFDDIIYCPEGSVILIDELSSIFNSRDFAKGSAGLSKPAFQVLLQCRKKRVQVLATAQKYSQVDKQLRDIADTIRSCSSFLKHPFTRICTVKMYDAEEYNFFVSNPLYILQCYGVHVYVQTDKLRNSYNNIELIDNLLIAEYEDDETILRNQSGDGSIVVNATDGKKKPKRFKK